MDYKAMYFHLFNAATDAIHEIDVGFPLVARDLLIEAQRAAEDLYLEDNPDEPEAGLTPEERYELIFHEQL